MMGMIMVMTLMMMKMTTDEERSLRDGPVTCILRSYIIPEMSSKWPVVWFCWPLIHTVILFSISIGMYSSSLHSDDWASFSVRAMNADTLERYRA